MSVIDPRIPLEGDPRKVLPGGGGTPGADGMPGGGCNVLDPGVIGLGEMWWDAGNASAGVTTQSGQNFKDYIIAGSLVAKRDAFFDAFYINPNGALVGGGEVRVGVYEEISPTNPMPGSLIAASGAFSIAVSLGSKIEVLGGPVALSKGKRYWLAFTANSHSISVLTLRSDALENVFGRGLLAGYGSLQDPRWGLQVAYPYSTLPATFPSSPTMIGNADLVQGCPYVGIRVIS